MHPLPRDLPRSVVVALGLAIALQVVRALLYPFATGATDLGPDGVIYAHHARAYAGERPPWPSTPPERAPGYPLTLSLVWRLTGESLTAARMLNAFLWIGTLGLTFLLAHSTVGPAGAWIATATFAWDEPFFYIKFVNYEVQLVFLTALALTLVLASLSPRRPLHRPLVAGLVLGLAALTSAKLVGLVPLLALALLVHRQHAGRPDLAGTLALLAGALLVIGPWAARNLATTGRLVVVSADGPRTFINGNNRYATGTASVPGDIAALRDGGSTTEQDARLVKAGLDFIAAHPSYWLTTVVPRKHGWFWDLGSPRAAALHLLGLAGFVVLGLAGKILAPWTLAAPVAVLNGIALAFHGEGHYRFAALPSVHILAGGLLGLLATGAAQGPGVTGSAPVASRGPRGRAAIALAGSAATLLWAAAWARSAPEVVQLEAWAVDRATWPVRTGEPAGPGQYLEVSAWINTTRTITIELSVEGSPVRRWVGPIDLSVWYHRVRWPMAATPARATVTITIGPDMVASLGPFGWPGPTPVVRGGTAPAGAPGRLLARTGSGPPP